MNKTWIGVLLLSIVACGFFVYYIVNKGEDSQALNSLESVFPMKDTEEVADIISYIQDEFSNYDELKNVYFDHKQKAIAVETSFTKDDLQEAMRFDEKIADQLQVYNKTGDRISYMVITNFSDGTPYSSTAFNN